MASDDCTQTSKCGVGRFQVRSLQCCATIVCFTGIYSLSSLTTSTLSIYISSQITTLERQFGFSSSQSGFLLSCNDAGFLLVTLFISYRATRAHIPRVLGLSTILYGIAGIMCSFAYFLMPSNNFIRDATNSSVELSPTTEDLHFCKENVNLTSNADSKCSDETNNVVGASTSFTPIAMCIIGVGMMLQGIGKSPRQSHVAYYIDENTDKTKTSLYLGVIMALGIFGPAFAYGFGALFNKIYVTLKETDIGSRDPRWIGAWWLGFLIFGISSIILSLPLFCFPKRLKEKKKSDKMEDLTLSQHMKAFFSTVVRLVKNGCFIFTLLGSCLQMFFIAGMISFQPKFLETQFTIPAWHANILMGSLNVTSAALGTLIGGYIVYRFRMTPYECIRLCVILTVITTSIPALGFVIGCDNPEINGFNVESHSNSYSCMETCNCDTDNYFPVCGSDNTNYFSYCHAGCTGRDNQIFTGCQCIGHNATASPGLCSPDCNLLYVYISIVFIFALTQTVAIMPEYIFTLRCVPDNDKAMAIAVRSLLHTLLGWFPGPVIYGLVIDTCCRIWNENCGKTGACALYDLVDFRYKKHALDLGLKCAAVIMYLLAFWFARKRTDLKETIKTDQEKEIIPEGELLMNKIDKS